ncbi:MAG TPA: two-component system response regulator [Chitinophagaceae bacterium]|nr:two-component system response regulator [Chitinophagaceae bacterium]HAN39959.1 two-component system response regulator [Chitinophagaceae bacterium]
MDHKHINVLYIDDEQHNLTAFKASFRRNFNVFIADSAARGLEIIQENDIHVILSDQRMPNMTGIELFEKLITINPEPIRILITGYADINAVIDAINKGQVYKYLTKPWIESDIVNFVLKAFEVVILRREKQKLTDELIDANTKLELLARGRLLS